MKSWWKLCLLLWLPLIAACGGNKDKDINKDRDKPQPPAKRAVLESRPNSVLA